MGLKAAGSKPKQPSSKSGPEKSQCTIEAKQASTLSVRRITIVTAAFIVAYTLATSISQAYENHNPGYYGELIVEEEGEELIEPEFSEGYLDMFCQGGRRHRYCR